MKLLDARAGIVEDSASTAGVRKVLGRDHNAVTINRLRSTPEASLLAKRMKKHGGENAITPLNNPISRTQPTVLHARIHSADEDKKTFRATLDQSSGLNNYKQAKRSFARNLPAHFHTQGDKVRRGRAAGDLDCDFDDARQKIHLRASCADEDSWKKVSEGVFGHLKIEHDESGQPSHVSLTDSASVAPAKYLKLEKTDGATCTVAIKPQSQMALSPMTKRDGSLDSFRRAMSKPAGSFGR